MSRMVSRMVSRGSSARSNVVSSSITATAVALSSTTDEGRAASKVEGGAALIHIGCTSSGTIAAKGGGRHQEQRSDFISPDANLRADRLCSLLSPSSSTATIATSIVHGAHGASLVESLAEHSEVYGAARERRKVVAK